MPPRKTQQGASASARKAPVQRRARDASPARPSTSAKSASSRPAPASRPKKDASWFRWWLLPPIVVAAAALFIVTYYPVARVQYRETRQRAGLQAEFSALQTRNSRLSGEVARLKTPEGVEDYARSQLGMVKQGERVVVVTDGTSKPSAVATLGATPQLENSDEATAAPTGPWTAFLDSVFKLQ